jgi:YVTN family beta-propeller protein
MSRVIRLASQPRFRFLTFANIVHVSAILNMKLSKPGHRHKASAFRRLRCSLVLGCIAAASFPSTIAMGEDASGRLITSAAIAVNPRAHKVYAVVEGADAVVVTDERTGSSTRIAVGKGPIAVAVLPAVNKVYVVNGGSNSISILDGAQDTAIATIPGGSHPYTIAADQKTNKVYVTYTYDHLLTVIDGSTNTASTMETGSADMIAIDEATDTLFLSTYEDPYLRIVDGATGAMHKVKVGGHIWGFAFDAEQADLYLAHTATADVLSYNEKTQETAVIPVGKLPCAAALNPATHKLYAVNYEDQTLSVIDTIKAKVAAVLPLGDHPQALAVDVRRNRVYVANVHGNSVTVIDGARDAIVGTYPAGQNPYALAVDEETGQLYAAVYGAAGSVRVDVPVPAE